MTEETLIPRKDRLWKAVVWLDEQKRTDPATVEEACKRFDLSPKDEEFLLQMWRDRAAGGKKSP